MGEFMISIDALKRIVATRAAPLLVDVRRPEAYTADERVLPGALWREPTCVGEWGQRLAAGTSIVLYCAHGQGVSQSAAAVLRDMGLDARVLAGGIAAWRQQGGPTILKRHQRPGGHDTPSRWVTRINPKIDRIACPWLIRRFVDPEAHFYFVAPDQVASAARELQAVPYDVEGVELSHQGDLCTFDSLIQLFGIDDPALLELAPVVRGADTARPDLAPEAAGLLAVSLGNSALAAGDDHRALDQGFAIYDALLAWRRFCAGERHNWPAKGNLERGA